MKGRIDLKEFIMGVKKELVEASRERVGQPFFELTDVEMETEFSLEASAEAEGGFKMFVSLKGSTKAFQSHKLTMKFKPLSDAAPEAIEGPLNTTGSDGVTGLQIIGSGGNLVPEVAIGARYDPRRHSPGGPLYQGGLDLSLSVLQNDGVQIEPDVLRKVYADIEMEMMAKLPDSES